MGVIVNEAKKEYTGLWIDRHVLNDQRFNGHEMIVYAYMMSFGPKFAASDAHMAKRLGISPKTIRNTMARLRAKGFVTGQWFNRKPVPYANVPR